MTTPAESKALATDIVVALRKRALFRPIVERVACNRAARRVDQLGLPDAVDAMDDLENEQFLQVVWQMLEAKP